MRNRRVKVLAGALAVSVLTIAGSAVRQRRSGSSGKFQLTVGIGGKTHRG